MIKEKENTPISGYLMLVLLLVFLIISLSAMIALRSPVFSILLILAILATPGFFFVNPNSSVVLVLFGDYRGTVKTNGFFWVNPLFSKRTISLRSRNFDSDKIKVNDKVGNPIQI